ncbi:hypothetical protein GCM10023206_32290 [Acinetobacter puyangensis]
MFMVNAKPLMPLKDRIIGSTLQQSINFNRCASKLGVDHSVFPDSLATQFKNLLNGKFEINHSEERF